jgi:hypothetical protein
MNSDFKDDPILLVYLEVVMLSPFMDLLGFIFLRLMGLLKRRKLKRTQNSRIHN